jgi:hypothetical protein
MDQLYYYVRKMDRTIDKTKEVIEAVERTMKDSRVSAGTGTLTSKEIIRFYLSNSANSSNDAAMKTQVSSLSTAAVPTSTDNSDTDSEGDVDDGDIPDDLNTDGEDDEDEYTQGQQIKLYWEKRSKHLRHDIAIAAWVCSPIPEVMDDAKTYARDEMDAVERVLRKWIISDKVRNT